MPETKIHIIESKDFAGTRNSALAGPGAHPELGGAPYTEFDDPSSFDTALLTAMSDLWVGDDHAQRLLVISAHGVPGSGGSIDTGNGIVDLGEYRRYFTCVPTPLTVYCSWCWGGYPGPLRAMQRQQPEPPTIIGPMVPIRSRHANHVQALIVEALREEAEPEPRLRAVVENANETWTEIYKLPPFRFASKDGSFAPPMNTAGLSEKFLERAAYRVIALQRQRSEPAGRTTDEPVIAVLFDVSGQLWRVYTGALADDVRVGQIFELTAKPFGALPAKKPRRTVGRLVDLFNPVLVEPGSAPRPLRGYSHKYSWAEQPPDRDDEWLAAGAESQRGNNSPCLRCSWATTGSRLLCHRSNCKEHDKL